MQRTYSGPFPRGRTLTDAGAVEFVRGVPSDVTDEQAKALDGDPDWSTPSKPSKPKGSAPDTKEP